MSNLIADLRTDYPPWMEDEQPDEVIATYKAERVRAAAALAAKAAEMREHQKALAAERADVAAALAEARDKLDAQDAEIAALRARLAAAIEALEQAQDCIRDETPECGTREEARDDTLAKIRAVILPRHDAAKEASDAG